MYCDTSTPRSRPRSAVPARPSPLSSECSAPCRLQAVGSSDASSNTGLRAFRAGSIVRHDVWGGIEPPAAHARVTYNNRRDDEQATIVLSSNIGTADRTPIGASGMAQRSHAVQRWAGSGQL